MRCPLLVLRIVTHLTFHGRSFVVCSKARAVAADSAEMDAAATAWLVALSRDARQALALKEDATAELNLLTIRGVRWSVVPLSPNPL